MSVINTTISHGIIFGSGTYTSPLTITGTGAINNHGTGQGIFGGTATVVNDGHITATSGTITVAGIPTVSTYSGVYLSDSGSFLDNTGTITASLYAAQLTSGGGVTNSGVLYGGKWGVESRALISITNSGTISGGSQGIVLSGGGFVSNGGLISGADGVGIGGAAGTVDNAGTIVSSGAGVALNAGGVVSNAAAGLISVTGNYAAVYNTGGAGTVTNAGTLSGYTGVSFVGTYNNTVIDSGTIIGVSGTAIAFGGGNDLLQFQPSSSVFIQGTVDGGGGVNTLEFASGATTGTLTGNNASFTNFAIGTVDAGASWVLAGNVTFGIGITLADNSGFTLAASGTVVNTGVITEDPTSYGIRGGGTAALLDNLGSIQAFDIGVNLRAGGAIINGASGNTTALISGNYGAYAASGLIGNYGTIFASGTGSESVLLGGTGQVSNHAGGLITGHNIGVDLSGGVATLINFGVVSAANNGALALYDGDVLMNGPGALIAGTRAVVMAAAVTTPVSDTLKNYGTITGQYGVIAGILPTTGTLHATIVDAGTIIGTGGTAIAALATSASASVNLTLRLLVGNDFIQGTVAGEANGTGVLDFVSGSGTGTLTGSGADFSNFQTAAVDTGANWTFAGSNTLGVNTTLVDAGTLTNAGLLVVDPPITVTGTFVNAGTLSLTAGSYVVQLASGGYFLNTTAGVVARPNGGGTYAPAIYSETGGTSRVVNLGTISSDRFNVGVKLNAGGTVMNGAATATSALIYGGFPVLIQGASGTVTNYGTLLSVPGFGGSGVVLNTGGAVNNGIGGSTAALIVGDSNGVKLAGGGTVLNLGTISGHNGIYARNAAATVMNSGSIAGSAGYGVYLEAGGTVTDAGSISGSTGAVAFGGVSAGLLILEHGYSLHGVRGSGGASATVELLGTSAGNAVTATYNGLGLTNVGTIAFAPTSTNYATLRISNTATLPHTIANFTGAHDTIDLTTLAFVSGSSSAIFNTGSDQLTVGYGTNFVTLQLGSGSYTGLGFTAVSDGASGTDIIAGPAVLTYAWIGPSADWKTATDWSSGVIPGTTATATIANAGSNTVTISAAESIAVAGVTLSNSNTLDVAGTLSPTGPISIVGAVLSVSAGGLITSAGNGTLIGGTGVVNNDGTISGGNRNGISLTGTVLNQGSINATVTATTIVNRGTISNTTAFATGVVATGGSFTEVINGTSGATSALIEGANTGVNLNGGGSGGTVVNYGTVIGGVFQGVDLYSSGGTVGLGNYGTILAGGGGLAYAAVHVASAAVINNTGVIEETAPDTAGVYVRSNPGVTNIGLDLNNSGLITAAGHAVQVNSTIPVVVTNSGTLIGSEGFAVFSTVATSQTLIDSGTIIGTSGTAVAFGAGNDLLQFQSSTSAFVQGTVDGAGGTNTLEFAAGASAGTLTGNGAVFADFSSGTVDSGAVWTLAGTISFASSVTLANAGTLTDIGSLSNAGLISGVAAVVLGGNGNVAMNVAAGSLGNTGAIAGGFGGVGADGVATTGGSGGSGGAGVELTGGGSLNNSGTVDGGAGGVGGAASVGFDGGAGGSGGTGVDVVSGSLTNASAIAGGDGGGGGLASGAGVSGGTGGLGGTGVDVASAGFTNTGAIAGGSGGTGGAGVGGASGGAGGAGGAGLYLASGSLTNNSAITGGAGGFGGVGSVSGVAGTGGDGVYIAAGNLTNTGTIAGGVGGTAGGIGVAFRASGTLIDAGAIIGTSTAVAFGGTASNLLVLEHGYSIGGQIIGSAGATNTLELLGTSAANAVTATYNTLGLTNFGTVAFAPAVANYATLKITNDATLPHTIANFTGLHDTIDLTTLAFVSGSSTATFNAGSDQLTVANGTNFVTLQLGSGSYTGFGVNPDGGIGTDITVGPALTYAWIGPSADWKTATDWSSGVIPGVSASATIADAGSNTVTISAAESIQVANLTLSNADTLLVDGIFAPTGSIGVTGALLSIASGGTVSTFATLTVAGTGTLIDSGALLDSGTLTNAGTIVGTGTGLSTHAVSLISGATLVNLAGGTVTSGAGSAVYWYTNLSTAASTVTNFGTIGGNGGDGVFFNTTGGVVTNRASAGANATISGSRDGVLVWGDPTPGVVTNTGGTNATALITGGTVGVFLFSSGTVTNSDGTITGGTTGVYLGNGPGITLVNAGDATGAALIAGGSDGVFAGPGSSMSIANTGGTIIGTSDYGIDLNGIGTVTNTGGTNAGALIQGGKSGIFLGAPTGDFLINTNATIIGTSRFGVYAFEGGSVTNTGTGALISGSVAGVFMGGGSIETVANYATIIGGIGVELFQAGTVIDAGTIIGTGGTAITLAGEGDTLKFLPGNAFIQGLVTSFNYHTRLEFEAGAAVGTLTGSDANFQNFPNGTVDAGASWVLAGGITLASSITLANSGTLTDSGTLINGGTITGLALDVPQLELAPGGYLLNQATGVITQNNGFGVYGQASGASTVTNHGTIAGYGGIGIGVYLKDGGTVTNTSAGAVLKGSIDGVSMIDAAGTVFNSSSIVGLGSLGNGVILLSGGTVTNAAGGVIGGGDGIRIAGAGTVLNQGRITGGTIDGGVVLMATGSVSNATTGVISGAAYGVGALGIATVTNAGMIRSTGTAGIGVTLVTGGTVIDSGTIAGAATAVAFGGTASNLLVLEHGYALTGGVAGSAGATNTVELLGTSAANAVTANYNALSLTNIGTIAFAPSAGNYATLKYGNDASPPVTITNFTGVHDTIDLTALNDSGNNATASFNSIANQLTVSAGGSSVTLQLGSGNYSSVAWTVLNDGSNGTDIHPVGAQPAISGTVAGQPTTDKAAIDPFSGVTIGDAASGETETVTVTLSNAADGTLQNLDGGTFNDGTYIVTGTTLAVTAALDGLSFQPTEHQVAPGDSVTTGFTIEVTDSNRASASDSTTTVIATAVNDPPAITHAVVDLGVPNETTGTPFSGLTVTDPDVGHTDTLTVTLSSAAGDGLSGFSSGGYDAATGVYTVAGTASQVTTALDALVFNPAPPAAGYVATTDFSVAVTGPGGSDSDNTINVTAVTQVLGLAATPSGDDVISVSPDGSGFAVATSDRTNEAVVSGPSNGGAYALPNGYQAAFLGGSANAALLDGTVGNALLVGNTGNDTLSATAANDTILGGSGTNLMFGGSGALVLSNGAHDTVSALSGGASVQSSGADLLAFGGLGSDPGALSVSLGGAQATVTAGNSAAAITTGGSNALVFGGSGASAGGISLVDTGRGDTMTAGDAAVSATLSGSNALVFGGFGSVAGGLNVADGGSGDTISTGNSAATVTGGSNGLLLFGGAGTLDFAGGSGPATVAAGSGSATVSGGSGGTTLFGGAGGSVALTGGNAVLYSAGSGNETLNAGGSSGGNELFAGSDASGADSIVGGSGDDTIFAGAGADTLAGGAGANIFSFVASLTHGAADVIADFSANDVVFLNGYGADDAATALGAAVSSGGSTTITLSDNTRIEFLGIGSVGALQGHVFSG